MNCLPSEPAQMEQEYQHRYSSRVRRVCVSGSALLLAAFTHAVLLAPLIASINERNAVFSVGASYAGAYASVLPITYFLMRIYLHSRADARQARAWLAELRALKGEHTA
jgi:hypothetical protein